MKLKQSLHQLSVASVLALILASGVCAGFFTMPALAKTEGQPVMVAMESCQGAVAHSHLPWNGPLVTTNHRAAAPADCCINHARYYQTVIRTSDSHRSVWTAAATPSVITFALVNYSHQYQDTSEIFPPPARLALASVIKLE